MQSKTLTILMADIQGFTSRTSSQTREENELFIRETHSFVEKHSQAHGGQLVKSMGDGFLVTFESPTDAIKCGLSMQQEISRRNANILNSNNFIRFRIGISTGEVNIDRNGDVFGDAVNIAARIEGFAEPNQVFISESTYLSMNQSEVSAMDLGPKQFKNVIREIRVYRVLDGQGEPTEVSGIPKKKTESHPYKYLWLGLAVGMLLATTLVIAVLISERRDLRRAANHKAGSALELDQPAAAEMPQDPIATADKRDAAPRPQARKTVAEANDMQIIDNEELNRIRRQLAFLDWAVRAEESSSPD